MINDYTVTVSFSYLYSMDYLDRPPRRLVHLQRSHVLKYRS